MRQRSRRHARRRRLAAERHRPDHAVHRRQRSAGDRPPRAGLPGPRLRAIIESHGLLATAARAGRRVTFANAFTPSYLRDLAAGDAPRVGDGARLHLRRHRAARRVRAPARRGRNLGLRARRLSARAREHVPAIEASSAGAHLAALAARHDLTLYETFLTDLVGHGRIPMTAGDALERLDRFLGGVMAARPPHSRSSCAAITATSRSRSTLATRATRCRSSLWGRRQYPSPARARSWISRRPCCGRWASSGSPRWRKPSSAR